MPLRLASARLLAFEHAFEVCGVNLTIEAKEILPELAATLTWASGSSFLDIAINLRSEMKRTGVSLASKQDLRNAMRRRRGQSKADSTATDFPSLSKKASNTVTFSSVGGNDEAKSALEDALALDPTKRQLLAKFGLPLPTGVLLYGPPGKQIMV